MPCARVRRAAPRRAAPRTPDLQPRQRGVVDAHVLHGECCADGRRHAAVGVGALGEADDDGGLADALVAHDHRLEGRRRPARPLHVHAQRAQAHRRAHRPRRAAAPAGRRHAHSAARAEQDRAVQRSAECAGARRTRSSARSLTTRPGSRARPRAEATAHGWCAPRGGGQRRHARTRSGRTGAYAQEHCSDRIQCFAFALPRRAD